MVKNKQSLVDISRHYVDLNLHMHTLNYDIGGNVSCDVFISILMGRRIAFLLSADVNKIMKTIGDELFFLIFPLKYIFTMVIKMAGIVTGLKERSKDIGKVICKKTTA